ALLHTRLSIRDLRSVADQPMTNGRGDVWITYNGEVYGWEAEAQALRAKGHVFNTTGDTEFILRAYEEWGIEGCLSRLRGMFAFAILDLRRRKLFLARDRMGIKPLIYCHRGGTLSFASTVRALLPSLAPGESRLSADAVDAYLAHRYVPAPLTIFENLRRLPHGHYAGFDIDRGTLALTPYWQPQAERERDYAAVLVEAVRLRTVSDRPVGLFLSGGVDSTTLAAVLTQQGYRDIAAYTASFPGSAYDESDQAAAVAKHLGLRHEILPIEQDIADDFETIVASLDEPFADPSAFPLWYIARAATRHVKVVMAGDGGDELFAGYKRYDRHLRSAWRQHRWLPRASGSPGRLPGRARKLLDELALGWPEAYVLRFSGMPPALRRFLQPGFACARPVYWDKMPRDPSQTLETLLEIDMHNYLPEYILRKGDLCTMAHGLELRVPLLDHRLYQSVLGLPESRRFTRPRKLALAGVCQPCVEMKIFEREKRGFNPPVADWLRQELRGRLDGLGRRLGELTAGQLDAGRCQQLVDKFLGADAARAEQVLQLLILAESLHQLRGKPAGHVRRTSQKGG
ncbi:MAG: asparagine synthase (glutamine-hydrolyzing), partial [Gammaproteobacteria bacterium]|nr:asparagine synthase (glutamine-hydrolyzing) [Gammaproteobacteria bacterium]